MENEERGLGAPPAPEPAEQPDQVAAKAADRAPDNGEVTYISAEESVERAPSDLVEKDIRVPEWDDPESGKEAWVKIRTLTANERARIRQVGMARVDSPVGFGEMEIQQFLAAVVKPTYNEHQVRKIHAASHRAFARIIDAHDELAAMSKEEIAEARKQFLDEHGAGVSV